MSDSAAHFKRLRGIYRSVFCTDRNGGLSPAGAEVLANLKQMSGYGGSPYRKDPTAMAYAVGQQDVVRQILLMINISDEEIYRLTPISNREESFSDD